MLEELIEKSKDGDVKTYTKLMQMIERDLYRIAHTKLHDEDDICDAIQNTMLILYKSIKKLKNNTYFKSGVYRILINECNKIYKSNAKKKKIIDKVALDTINKSNSDDSEIFKNFMNFNSIISSLDSDEQLIFSLYYKDKYSCKEISKILKSKEGTIKSKLARGREKIRKD